MHVVQTIVLCVLHTTGLMRQFIIVQIKTAPLAILGAFVTIIVASIIPALRGADMEQKGAGPFTKVIQFR